MRNLFFYVVSAALLVASPAWSLSVTIDSLAFGASNSPDTDAGSNANTSAIQTIASGGALADAVGASENAGVRYSANQWSDASFGNNEIFLTHSYDVTLTISANAGTVYDISIDTIFSGMVQRIDDSFSGYGDASVSTAAVQLDRTSTERLPHGCARTNSCPASETTVTGEAVACLGASQLAVIRNAPRARSRVNDAASLRLMAGKSVV